MDKNEIQPSADEKDFTQKEKISGAMKIVHEARALDEGILEKARAAGIDVLGIIESLMSSVMHQQQDGYTEKDVIKVYECFIFEGIMPIIDRYKTGFTLGSCNPDSVQEGRPVAIALYPRTGLLEEFRDGTLKKTQVEWILEDLYEPKRIVGLLFGYLTSLAEDNKAKIDELKSALYYAKELAEKE
ncbi:hypothetical protein BH18THE2_BH18THE2_34300 [soil metagenome]